MRQIGKAGLWQPATMPEAVVFDMDGLLLDTERLYTRAIYATCDDLGYEMTTELNLRLIGGPWEANLAELLKAFGDAFPADRYRGQCEAHYLSQCADGIALRPGALELVNFLADRAIPMAVATSTPHLRFMQLLLRMHAEQSVWSTACATPRITLQLALTANEFPKHPTPSSHPTPISAALMVTSPPTMK